VTIPPSDPTRVFAALSDPTRRRLIDWLASGETGTATDFAARLPISRQAVARHLNELADAGLVSATRHGKEVRYRLVPEPLAKAGSWLQQRAAKWDRALTRLAEHVMEDPERGSNQRP
jgi:DNA-binding transcriptional ArsR family regulator